MIGERARRRYQPTRAGVINLWDYRDDEFSFVDGWLVLRGPNGSGKTKALEVLFPFVLDGRIEPRRLNPFASEDRTMKSNLLYRGQDVAHAYVWMEFFDGDSYVTIGIGLRAHRHVDRVNRWHFVAEGRVGVDFSLLDADDRPLNRRSLLAELGADAVRDSPEEYRRLVDARLFGLGPARYEQMLDLVLTLRKPQLAKDLNPVELSRTLQRGLRPLDEHLLVEAARSFDDMESVARTLEGLVAADGATSAFLSIYSTYLRTHAKSAADILTGRRAAVDEQRAAVASARREADAAVAAERAATALLQATEGEPGRLRAQLDSLKSSAAYQSVEQLADLERHVADLAALAERATTAAGTERQVLDRRREEWERAGADLRSARSTVANFAADLTADAEAAGLAWTPGPAADLLTRVSALVSARQDDVRAIRDRAARVGQAERDHERAAREAKATSDAADTAAADHGRAEAGVGEARQRVRESVGQWAEQFEEVLVEGLVPALTEAVDRAGEDGGPGLREVYSRHTASAVADRRDQLAALAARRESLVARRHEVRAERDRIAAEHDDAPPVPVTRTASRDGRSGAPLWRLVRFAAGIPDAEAASVEAALHAAGMLDAWVHPESVATDAAVASVDSDGYLTALPAGQRPSGRTLADLLVADEEAEVGPDRIHEVLASVAVTDALDAPVSLSVRGQYRQGITTGAHTKPAAEYIGAAARARRRAIRIAECDATLALLDGDIADVDGQRARLTAHLSTMDDAAEALPSLGPVHAALREIDRTAAVLRARREAAEAAAQRLDQAVAERAAAQAALRRAAAERALAPERVDDVADAVNRFERTGLRLDAAHTASERAGETEHAARLRHEEATERLAAAEEAVHEAALRHVEKDEAYRTLKATIGVEADRVLAEVVQVEGAIAEAEVSLTRVRGQLSEAQQARAAAGTRVSMSGEALARSVAETHQDAQRLRPFAHADLLGLLRCPTDLRWPAESPDEGDLDPQIVALHEAILVATRELTPSETSLKQSTTRLTTALTDLQAELPATGLDHRPEWDTDGGLIVVRIADEEGRSAVAHFAERIARERREQEQLLTEAEQRVLEDALLGQLARQIHQRTIEARDLVGRMDSQMRARRMSSGLTVGVGWQLSDDLDADQREACRLLERDPARLGPAQLTTLRRHFADRIKAARGTAPELPYRELLGQVLDYRQWRVFAFTLHHPDGRTEALTRARHSQLSGGEQSVSLHLPLFAAANALFSSARSTAPRVLGLDEAFAGVDDTGRGELMSLARQFDLDLFMTGYDLWATHAAVTGAAHYDLSHSAVSHTVSTVLLVWDGTSNIADFDGTLARALGSPETRRVPGARAAAVPDAILDLVDE